MRMTLFDYRYRDGGNFKANGTIALEGEANTLLVHAALSRLEDGEYFVAEQLGVPPLQPQLYRWSGGPTPDDHGWHEFVGTRCVSRANLPSDAQVIDSARAFFAKLAAVGEWRDTRVRTR